MLGIEASGLTTIEVVLTLVASLLLFLAIWREKRIKKLTEKNLFRVWYDWWHAGIGFLCGGMLLKALFGGSAIMAVLSMALKVVYFIYQIAEAESHEQTIRDLETFSIGDEVGFAMFAVWLVLTGDNP